MTCHCEKCSKDPKPTWTVRFMRESYVREIARRSGDEIKDYLDQVKEKQGIKAWAELRDEVLIVWKNTRNAEKKNQLNTKL